MSTCGYCGYNGAQRELAIQARDDERAATEREIAAWLRKCPAMASGDAWANMVERGEYRK